MLSHLVTDSSSNPLPQGLSLADCKTLDAQDPLGGLRDLFDLPDGVIYLDGNSLGALPKSAPARVAEVVKEQWGNGLIRSWNSAGWINLPHAVGDKIAGLIGAKAGEVLAADSTSVNLYKVLSVAIQIAQNDAPHRTLLLSERGNFPTDLYIAQGLCAAHGFELKCVEPSELMGALNDDVAVLLLTHVNYRSGALHDMAAVCAAARSAGVLTVWDLAHSVGAVPLDVTAARADFAVGCGYKFLNGGPGAPAFVWANPRHAGRLDSNCKPIHQPLAGWLGHAAPFAFAPGYAPAAGINSYLCGTPPIVAMAALDCGVDTLLAAERLGGMAALRAKSLALSDLFITLVQTRCAGQGLALITPMAHALRGSQVSFTHQSDAPSNGKSSSAFAIMQALIARGVIGDFRAGDGAAQHDILRFGLTPLYTGFADVWQAVEHLRQVLAFSEWQDPRFHQKQAVT
jgi:kynureninase